MFEDPEIRIHKLQPCTLCPRLEDLRFSWYFRYIHDRCLRSSACHQDPVTLSTDSLWHTVGLVRSRVNN
ncbi:hypothetical protein C5P11_23705 [Escherichia coli]|uniref:Uncharacterized protein n=1 Tax=Escherichia coli TaxID=562 RepID=A0A3L9IE84_ECOLX|nr:hypothetical protein CR539_25370 [Escherichia coli]EBZ8097325.1 hypothetical protein [Salmonella enterica subsp. enterica serovar Typhimurium]ECA0213810.1 hypothetical protein [Salmonella enterica subsp. enterica serovar Typhimurium]ECG4004186.1 hypothetical protein [Salmonella enterica subsp. enterica serovar Typhimurium]EEW0969640.1 hypothetical protein [Escherichia coli]